MRYGFSTHRTLSAQILLSISVFAGGISCVSSGSDYVKESLSSFMGREITISEQHFIPVNYHTDTTLQSTKNYKYKIVVYFAENECSDCNMKSFFLWRNYVNSLKSDELVAFYFIFRSVDAFSFIQEMSSHNNTLPYLIDSNGIFEEENPTLPTLTTFHTFLLKDNRVHIVGSPIDNAKVLLLYKQELGL